ncbi:M23 family metallopeptidase [Nitrospira tepida]|uniref:M23 family metallopeptidase n=1 Tax=Nitrospira tepida TaxID=2973512 RepID=A0AA86N1A5_9BACT|nr:M23 family metallopeptidase [Nitrospira tepida]CAI4032720.1 M23 family metallopeptidase [Nitrospira tepida]
MRLPSARPSLAMGYAERVTLSAIVILASIFPVEWFPSGPQVLHGTDGQLSGKQGQVLVVKVPIEEPTAVLSGTFMGRTIPFFPEYRPGQGQGFVALLGLDLQDEPGTHELVVEVRNGEQQRRLSYNILVLKEKFNVERLKLPKEKVDLDEEGLARYKSEQEQVRAALAEDSRIRLWSVDFREPVGGKRSGRFGSVRVLNGQPKSPHRGEDIAAPAGTEVVATNDGIVRLTVDHVFSGLGIYLDHGLGLYSMYFHLSEVLVKDGDPVKAGQVIGKVGASGRATGPHLHWGARVNGAWINPYALVGLPLLNGAAPR